MLDNRNDSATRALRSIRRRTLDLGRQANLTLCSRDSITLLRINAVLRRGLCLRNEVRTYRCLLYRFCAYRGTVFLSRRVTLARNIL